MLLDEELDQGGEAVHGRVVEAGPARLGLGVDEGVLGQQRLADLDAPLLRGQVEGALALQVKHVHPSVVVKEYLKKK